MERKRFGCSDARLAKITGDGESTFTADSGPDTAVAQAAPSPLAGVRVVLGGKDIPRRIDRSRQWPVGRDRVDRLLLRTEESGLPSSSINALHVDSFGGGRTLLVATANCLATLAIEQ
ncbi:MAG TPA: hypothetical protein VGL86_31600 [Polyangia bacterium]|jgi:hypothetical protein